MGRPRSESERRTPPRARRRFLRDAASAAGLILAAPAVRAGTGAPRFAADPFALGVASGYPLPDGVVLWTRLAPDPFSGGPREPVAVDWEVAHDERFMRVARKGRALAGPEWAHSLHVEVQGLEPDRWYFYRFRAGDALSPVGRTRTAPARGQAAGLRFGVASCSHYEQGYFSAYRHMAADELDLVIHVGDYVYESSWGSKRPRLHDAHAAEPVTLDDYRARYALYKSDSDLRAAHAACPWLVTWDDHEVDNDYADDRSQDLDHPRWFLARRANAYRAYYEHMPLRSTAIPLGPDMRLHGQLAFGDDVALFVLDDRQYRSPQPCPRAGRGGSVTVDLEACPGLDDPARSLLGPVQEEWLRAGLTQSKARWSVIAQQTRIATLDMKPGPGRRYWTDGWDGYPAARRRLLEGLAAAKTRNPIVVGGDVHSFWVSDLQPDPEDEHSPAVAAEFVGTSITSETTQTREQLDSVMRDNPHVKLADAGRNGYLRVELSPEKARVDLRVVSDRTRADATRETLASFVVEDGRPGAQRA